MICQSFASSCISIILDCTIAFLHQPRCVLNYSHSNPIRCNVRSISHIAILKPVTRKLLKMNYFDSKLLFYEHKVLQHAHLVHDFPIDQRLPRLNEHQARLLCFELHKISRLRTGRETASLLGIVKFSSIVSMRQVRYRISGTNVQSNHEFQLTYQFSPF